jgi:hypothetical protein
VRAPADEFLALLQRGLVVRGVLVEPAGSFDLLARAFGARSFVKVDLTDAGLSVTAKTKSGIFASPKGLERLLLEAGREAQAKLSYDITGA